MHRRNIRDVREAVANFADGRRHKIVIDGGKLVLGEMVELVPPGPDAQAGVPAEVQAERMAACMACEKRRHTDGEGDICVACGCGSDRRLERLVTLVERPPVKRCRHPRRGDGCGWAVPSGSQINSR